MEFVVEVQYENERIDKYLSIVSNLTRSHIKKLIDDNKVLVNQKPIKASYLVKANDLVFYEYLEPKKLDATPQNIPIEIVYEDSDLAIINKPQGLTVHAGSGTNGSTLVNALMYHLDSLSTINGVIRPGIVHRIDKNTSGLLLVAKNDASHVALAKQIEEKSCKRKYLALLNGIVKEDSGVIKTYINRSKNDRTKMAVSSNGKIAETHFKVIERFRSYTLCEFSLMTGRTHQIRVHAKYMHHSVVGDKEYGVKDKFKLNGQLLHAYKIEFTHPTTLNKMEFSIPLPKYFEEVINKLKG